MGSDLLLPALAGEKLVLHGLSLLRLDLIRP